MNHGSFFFVVVLTPRFLNNPPRFSRQGRILVMVCQIKSQVKPATKEIDEPLGLLMGRASSDRDGGLESNGLKSPFGVESRVSTPAVT